MRIKAIAATLSLFAAGTASAINASDCEDAAHKAKREASSLEDAAQSGSPDDIADTAEEFKHASAKALRECTAPQPLPAEVAYQSFRAFVLGSRSKDPAVKETAAACDDGLRALAGLYARSGTGDLKLAYLVALTIYDDEARRRAGAK